MYILKSKLFLISLLSLFLFIPTLLLAYTGTPIPGYEGNTTSPKACETNTVREGSACLWEAGGMSWCGLNEQICQIEPTDETPAPIANGSYSFSCSSCQYELNCNPNYKACNDSCVAILNCEPNEVFDACLNSCISAPSTGSGFLASNPFFYLSESAYVGIGTNTPLTKLHLYDNTNGPVISLSGLNSNYRGLTTRDLDNNEKWFIGNNSFNNFVIRRNSAFDDITISSSTGAITLSTTTINGDITADRFCIGSNCATSWDLSNWASSGSNIYRASGKVGIGTESPSTALHVLGTTTASTFCLGTSCINAWPGGGSGEVSSISSNNNSLTINPINGTGDVDVSLNLNNINTWTASQTFNATTTFPNNSILNTAGDLGLGTSTPVTKLHLFHNTSGPIISLSGLTTNYRGLAIRDINNTENWFIGSNLDNKFVIRRQEEDSNDIVVNSDGNVGIGTSSPSQKLSIEGSVLASEYCIGSECISNFNNQNYWALLNNDLQNINNGNVLIGEMVDGIFSSNQKLTVFGNILSTNFKTENNNVLVGIEAGKNIGDIVDVVAVGYQTSFGSSGKNSTNIGYQAGYTSSGWNQTAIGHQAGFENTGADQTAVGFKAGFQNTGTTTVALGYLAGANNTGSSQVAIGHQAGLENVGSDQTAIGFKAGFKNTGTTTVALGYAAGANNTGDNQVALGHSAGGSNSGDGQTAVGSLAGALNEGNYQTVFGTTAGVWNKGNRQLAIGGQAGFQNQGHNQLVIGYQAGYDNTGNNQIALGDLAGYKNIGSTTIAIGLEAAYENIGSTTVAIGYQAGKLNEGDRQMAIGHQAGIFNKADNQTAIGIGAGWGNQAANQIAIGDLAGFSNTGINQIALGYNAGQTNMASNTIAIGYEAGISNQGNNTIAIGYQAGLNNEAANMFILKQANVKVGALPLILGNFLSGKISIGSDDLGLSQFHVPGNINAGTGFNVNNVELITTGRLVRAANGSVSAPSFSFSNSTSTGMYLPSANNLALAINGSQALLINAESKMGFGTNVPKGKMHIKTGTGSIINHNDPGDLIVESSNLSSRIDLVFPNTTGSAGGIQFYRGVDAISSFMVSSDNLILTHEDGIVLSASSTAMFYADKFGFNIENPQADLHVNGTIRGQYQSNDGSSGISSSTIYLKDCSGNNCSLVIKNGIITSSDCTDQLGDCGAIGGGGEEPPG